MGLVSGISPTINGRDFNFYQKLTVSNTAFGTGPNFYADVAITFATTGLIIMNYDSSVVISGSFNGQTQHFEINPTITKGLSFDNRRISGIWLSVPSSSAVCVVMAW